ASLRRTGRGLRYPAILHGDGTTGCPPESEDCGAKSAATGREAGGGAYRARMVVVHGRSRYGSFNIGISTRDRVEPNYATAHHWYGNGPLNALGRFDEAVAEGRRAVELDPLSPIINADLGQNLCVARRYDEAIAQLRKTLEIDPTFYYAHYKKRFFAR